jgi:hypothetical protein
MIMEDIFFSSRRVSKRYGSNRRVVDSASTGRLVGSQEQAIMEEEEHVGLDGCRRCSSRRVYGGSRYCWDCEHLERGLSPGGYVGRFPEYFGHRQCSKCSRFYVGFMLGSKEAGCPYSDCLHEATEVLKRVVGRYS